MWLTGFKRYDGIAMKLFDKVVTDTHLSYCLSLL